MRPALLLSAAALVSLTACNNSIDAANSANGEVATNGSSAAGDAMGNGTAADAAMAGNGMMGDAMPAMSDQQFADTMAASDQFEIQSSQLAQQKAAGAEVKTFAAMLIKDHTKSTAELKAAAAKASPPITPAPALTPEQTSNLATLRSTPAGAGFDTVYLSQQVPAHEMALTNLKAYAAAGGNADFKAFATKTQTPVSMHLERARALQK